MIEQGKHLVIHRLIGIMTSEGHGFSVTSYFGQLTLQLELHSFPHVMT